MIDNLVLARIDPKTKSLLDCGCGNGSNTFIMKFERKIDYDLGCDIWLPSLKIASKICDGVVLCDVMRLPFREKSFEHVHAGEVLEHFDKSKGYTFISEMDRVAKRKITLTTPNGFVLGDATQTKENLHQRHLSGWTYFELKRLGFNVRGTGIIGSWGIKMLIRVIFSGISYIIPFLGADLIAYCYKSAKIRNSIKNHINVFFTFSNIVHERVGGRIGNRNSLNW